MPSCLARTRTLAILTLIALAASAAAQQDRPADADDNGNTRFRVRKLDDPKGEFSVEPLANDTVVRLTGRINLLRVSSLNGAAMLDASELQASRIIVSGTVADGTSLKLRAPDGEVALNGMIAGAADVEINAPDGVVIIGSDAPDSRVDGGAKLNISAREVILRSPAAGGVRIAITLSKGGKLKYGVLDGGAQITYAKAANADPDPKIEPGEIRGGASCREGAPDTPMARLPAPPKDAFPVTATPEPTIPAGLILLDGQRIAAQIVSIDETQVTCRRSGAESESIPLEKVALVLFRPFPESRRASLSHDAVGLLLRNGDYVEGPAKSLTNGQITISSVLFGLKTFEVETEAVALVLRRSMTLPPQPQ